MRRRDARMLARVFEHNRQDIVSLAALAVLACQWVEEGRAEDPRDVFSLARVLERARLYDRSEAEYRRALDLGPGALRGPVAAAPRVARQAGGGARSGRGALGRGGRGRRGGGLARAGHAPRAPGPGPRRRRSPPSSAGCGWSSRSATATCGPGTWPRASSGGSSGCCGRGRSRGDVKARPGIGLPRGLRDPSRARRGGARSGRLSRSRAAGTRRGPGSGPAS